MWSEYRTIYLGSYFSVNIGWEKSMCQSKNIFAKLGLDFCKDLVIDVFDHQTLHGFSEIIRSPAWHWKAWWKSSLFFKVSKTLTIAGGCGSPCSCPTKSPKVLASHHPRAYPMKNSYRKILEVNITTKVNPAGFISWILIGILQEFAAVCFYSKKIRNKIE